MNTQLDIARLVNQQIRQTLTEYLDGIDLRSLIEQAMASAVDDVVTKMTTNTAEVMITQRDLPDEVLRMARSKIDGQVDSQVRMSVRAVVDTVDIKKLVSEAVSRELNVNIKQYSFPDASINASSINWNGMKFSGNMVDGGIIQNFNSTGIQDNSTSCQLTIMDDILVVEGHLLTNSSSTRKLETDRATINDLVLAGRFELSESASESVRELAREVLAVSDSKSLDLTDRSIRYDGKLLMDGSSLGPGIMTSNLRKVGTLQDLKVSGPAKFNETLLVTDRGRIGINTEEPAGALTVWDEDAEITVTKLGKRNMFVGSTRNTDVTIGTNNRNQLHLGQALVEVNDPLRIMGMKISVIENIPESAGEPGELVFVKNARQGEPFMYICKNGNWNSLGVIMP